MNIADIAILAVVLVVLGIVIAYIVHKKKSGAGCIGCDSSSCHCGCSEKDKKESKES